MKIMDYSAMVGFDTIDGCPLVDGERVWDLKRERDAALARVKELEQERDNFKCIVESDTERLSELADERNKLLENQFPDLSQWPSGCGLGIDHIGRVLGLAWSDGISGMVGWKRVGRVDDDGCLSGEIPIALVPFMKWLHHARGRPCPWDEDHGKVTLTSKHPGPESKDEPAAMAFTGTATGSSATEATINYPAAGDDVERVVFNGRTFVPVQEPPQPPALDEQVALLRKRVADLERRLDEMEQQKTEE